MGKALADKLPVAQGVFDDADRALGMRLSSLCFEGPDEELRLTANTQPALLTTCIAALRALESAGVTASFVAGHSLGEYSALVAAGCLRFEDALHVVRQRGLFMQEAVPAGEGAMAALTGCDIELVNSVCREASILGICGPANLNSPNQTVIAGHRPAVERAVELAKAAAERLGPVLAATEFGDLEIPLVTNVDAGMVTTGVEAREALIRQVASPVRWSDSVRVLIDSGVTRFIEVGPGKVLAGLIRQINRESQVLSVADPDSLDATVASLQL
jgi:[acyl-carrier-protein] S-malonyltransferase